MFPTHDPQETYMTGTPAPRWSDMPTPPKGRRILGSLITPSVAGPFCDEDCPLLENADDVEVASHYSQMKSYIPYLMAERHGSHGGHGSGHGPFHNGVLVYRDGACRTTARAAVLADTRAPFRAHCQPHPRDVAERVAEDLGLEGDGREPRWYKPAS